MNRLEFLDKLRMVYCGDKNAFDDISAEQERLSIIEEKYKDCTQYYVNGFKEEIDRLNNIINDMDKQIDNLCNNQKREVNRLNNIINELSNFAIKIYQKELDKTSDWWLQEELKTNFDDINLATNFRLEERLKENK